MRQQVLRDAFQPSNAERVEPRVLEGRKQIRGRLLGRLMFLVDTLVVKSLPDREAIAEGAQAADGRGIRERQPGLEILRRTWSGDRACACANGFDGARGEGARHASVLVAARAGPRDGKLVADAALVVLGDEQLFVLVAAVQEGQLEGQRLIVKQRRVFGPGDDRAR